MRLAVSAWISVRATGPDMVTACEKLLSLVELRLAPQVVPKRWQAGRSRTCLLSIDSTLKCNGSKYSTVTHPQTSIKLRSAAKDGCHMPDTSSNHIYNFYANSISHNIEQIGDTARVLQGQVNELPNMTSSNNLRTRRNLDGDGNTDHQAEGTFQTDLLPTV